MRILCIGDVVGSIGCEFLRNNLPTLKKVKGVDFVICNGENSADGNGLTPVSAKHLFDSGVDAITLGNHSFRRKEVYDCLDSNPFIVRPANFPENSTPGKGIINVDTGRRIVSIINIMGNSYMDNNLNCAFECVDKMIKQAESKIIIVDFHTTFLFCHIKINLICTGSPEGNRLHNRHGNDGYNPFRSRCNE